MEKLLIDYELGMYVVCCQFDWQEKLPYFCRFENKKIHGYEQKRFPWGWQVMETIHQYHKILFRQKSNNKSPELP